MFTPQILKHSIILGNGHEEDSMEKVTNYLTFIKQDNGQFALSWNRKALRQQWCIFLISMQKCMVHAASLTYIVPPFAMHIFSSFLRSQYRGNLLHVNVYDFVKEKSR